MTRKAHLEPHLSSNELKTRYQLTTDKVESRRWHLLWLVSQKWTIKQAAVAVGLNYDYAKDIVRNYNQQGEGDCSIEEKSAQRVGVSPCLMLHKSKNYENASKTA